MRRTDGFPHCPDIVVNSTYWDELEEVAAFEELVGSHGGMGGGQAHPFVLHPPTCRGRRSRWSARSAVHRILRRWLVAARPGRLRERQRVAGRERLDDGVAGASVGHVTGELDAAARLSS